MYMKKSKNDKKSLTKLSFDQLNSAKLAYKTIDN